MELINKFGERFSAGDLVICKGFGYPHWKNHIFEVKAKFPDGHILLQNNIKVNPIDFSVYVCVENLIPEYKSLISEKGFLYFGLHLDEGKRVNPIYNVSNDITKIILDVLGNIDIIDWFYDGMFFVVITKTHLIFLDNDYSGDYTMNTKHLIIELQNIIMINYDGERVEIEYKHKKEIKKINTFFLTHIDNQYFVAILHKFNNKI